VSENDAWGKGTFDPPGEWRRLVPVIQDEKGPVMVLGAPDTGKSSLIRFLARELSARGERVAYIDGDMGQSILGPPTTQGVALVGAPWGAGGVPQAGELYFVGSTSPRGHRVETLIGLKKLLERCLVDRGRVALIDTTGYVTGEDDSGGARRRSDPPAPLPAACEDPLAAGEAELPMESVQGVFQEGSLP